MNLRVFRRVAAEDLPLSMRYPCPARNPLYARTLLGRAEYRTAMYMKKCKHVCTAESQVAFPADLAAGIKVVILVSGP